MENKHSSKSAQLFTLLSCFFVANALIAECIGTKIFNAEASLGLPTHTFSLFGENNLSYMLTCGVLLWPLEFVMTDIVNEYFGTKAVKRISYIAIALISYAFIVFYVAQKTIPAAWWLTTNTQNGVPNMQAAFSSIFGQSQWIIVGSLVAFYISQWIDVFVFHKIKKRTGEKYLWLRATGSTVVSQLIDSFIVLFIAFKIGSNWSWQKVVAIACVNYSYKFLMAILLTPLVNIVHFWIEKYLGIPLANEMKKEAMHA